jgi:hypothetical protein
MADEENKLIPRDYVVESIKAELDLASPARRQRIFEAIALAALGSIPWVGGVIAAASVAADKIKTGEASAEKERLFRDWLQQHQEKLQSLHLALNGIVSRLDSFGDEVEQRITSDQYLTLVRKTFRQWDEADTEEKRKLLVQLITNAGGTRIVSDDIVRLFLDWIDLYHEVHFAVIREIYSKRNDPPTRYDIWAAIYGEPVPKDSSAEADLFRMLIRDLSTGGVIRQPRETDFDGRFRKRVRPPRRSASTGTMESAFEDTKTYVLTELGSQFVHYTMNELVDRLPGRSQEP